MSNPTTLVGTDAFSKTGPERYLDGGLWLEEGTVNGVTNPSFEVNTTNWGANNTGNTIARSTIRASDGSASLLVSGDGSVSQQGAISSPGGSAAASGQQWALAADIYSPAGGETVRFVAAERTGAGTIVVDTPGPTLTLAAGWHRRFSVITLAGGVTTELVRFKLVTPTSQVIALNLDACQIEHKPYATSYTASTRAASSASISPTGILDPATGSLAFRLTRKIDTGDIEYILNCGTDGDDRLRIYIDTDDRLRVAWDTGGALPQSVVSSSTIAVGTEYLVYTEWDGINIAMSLDAGTLVTGIRDVPLGSWGTDDLVLGP
jgi:hypothetical protein